MAAATVVDPDPTDSRVFYSRSENTSNPLSDCRLLRWTLSIANTNTHDTKIGTRVGIVDWALKPNLVTGDQTMVTDITDGVFTFATAGTSVCELLVWVRG